MLLEMRLRGLGVIADAVLELGPGLTVVTGETGAGKTMVVTGLGLLMGGRADAASVREGARTATVEGRVLVDPAGRWRQRAVEAGAELDDGDVLIVTRTVSAEGRGRTHLGGRSVPVGVLAEIAEHLVTVHGQSDQIRLRSPGRQREALDRFAGPDMAEVLAAYRATWQRLRHVEGRLAEIVAARRERQQEAELLRIGLAEVERVQPQPGEDDGPAGRVRPARPRRGAAARRPERPSGATGDPDGPGGASTWPPSSAQARRALDQVAGHDPALAALADRLGEIGYLVADVAAEMRRLRRRRRGRPRPARRRRGAPRRADGPRPHPRRRRRRRARLGRQAAPRLLELDGDEDRTAELHGQREQLRAELARRGRGAVPHAGRPPPPRSAEAVSGELADLSMPDARLVVEVRQREDADGSPSTSARGRPRCRYAAGPDGIDEVEFLLVPHPGAPARPIAKGASGGELSRVMLGLEVVLGGRRPGARRSSSTRSTRASAAGPRSGSAAGWPGSPAPRRCSSSPTWPRSPRSPTGTSPS